MASHAFITSWLLASRKKDNMLLGKEWSVGFRGQEYANTKNFRQVMTAEFSFSGGDVGISPSSASSAWDSAFSGEKDLMFCGYYWWNNGWFGGFIDWWPITEGNRSSRGLGNADGQFEAAWKLGIKQYCFVITDGSSRRTNFGVIKR